MKVLRLVSCFVAAAIVLQATSSWSGIIAYDGLPNMTRNQTQAAGTSQSGMDFDVLAPGGIRVTHVGSWDEEFPDGLGAGVIGAGNFRASIFSLNPDKVSGTLVPGTDVSWDASSFAGLGGFFQSSNMLIPITPVVLPPGSYTIASDPNAGQFNAFNSGNVPFSPLVPTNDGGGLISFVGSSRWDNNNVWGVPVIQQGMTGQGTFAFPLHAGTFMYEAIPEPTALVLTGLSLLGCTVVRRRS